jgi:hypothetical protein
LLFRRLPGLLPPWSSSSRWFCSVTFAGAWHAGVFDSHEPFSSGCNYQALSQWSVQVPQSIQWGSEESFEGKFFALEIFEAESVQKLRCTA